MSFLPCQILAPLIDFHQPFLTETDFTQIVLWYMYAVCYKNDFWGIISALWNDDLFSFFPEKEMTKIDMKKMQKKNHVCTCFFLSSQTTFSGF